MNNVLAGKPQIVLRILENAMVWPTSVRIGRIIVSNHYELFARDMCDRKLNRFYSLEACVSLSYLSKISLMPERTKLDVV